ncbi:unnamed protein product [Closterium sp. Naga37s-1]|nr:unnamed protein product [Closterium sp. Naga37s-1]
MATHTGVLEAFAHSLRSSNANLSRPFHGSSNLSRFWIHSHSSHSLPPHSLSPHSLSPHSLPHSVRPFSTSTAAPPGFPSSPSERPPQQQLPQHKDLPQLLPPPSVPQRRVVITALFSIMLPNLEAHTSVVLPVHLPFPPLSLLFRLSSPPTHHHERSHLSTPSLSLLPLPLHSPSPQHFLPPASPHPPACELSFSTRFNDTPHLGVHKYLA